MLREEEREDRVIGQLVGELSGESRLMLRQFVELARIEMSQKFSMASRDMIMVAAGGALAYAGLLAVVASLVMLLAYVAPWWVAALVVGAAISLVAWLLIRSGLAEIRRKGLLPRETLEALKEETEWLGQQMK